MFESCYQSTKVIEFTERRKDIGWNGRKYNKKGGFATSWCFNKVSWMFSWR
jgi:hypothetical protein